MNSFYIHKLGCPKNDVDADHLIGFLLLNDFKQVFEPEAADLLIVNTCGFIQPAKEESIEAILELAALKKGNRSKKLLITGCLSQRYADAIAAEMPEVDGIFGIENIESIKAYLDNAEKRSVSPTIVSDCYREYPARRTIDKSESFAYIKISDGCDNRCGYCAIPLIRGPYRSRKIEAIVDEASFLLDQGKKELILVSQESTAFGKDNYGKSMIVNLLEEICRLNHDFWLRVMYMHPARVTKELIDYMIDNPKICSYFDIPVQHINDRILKLMNRKIDRKGIEKVLDHIKMRDSDAAIRTTLIVGFPGETEDDFRELYQFVEERQFDRMGTFAYSPEENTPAEKLPDHIEEDVKAARCDDLMLLQQGLAFERNENSVGNKMEVIIDSVDKIDGTAVGRTRYDAPEIDQTVRIHGIGAEVGDRVTVTITGYDGYDLLGERECHE